MRYFFTHLIETERVQSDLKPGKFKELVKSSLLKELRFAYMKKILVKDNQISFTGNIFRFVWNGFNLFNPISNGKISFKNIGKGIYITYKMFFWEFFIIALIFSTIPALGIFPNMAFRFLSLAIIWILYLLSSLIAAHRFEKLLKKIVLEHGGKI